LNDRPALVDDGVGRPLGVELVVELRALLPLLPALVEVAQQVPVRFVGGRVAPGRVVVGVGLLGRFFRSYR
jgi:hypothetical protein